MQGRIKYWNSDKFYGFIESGGESFFFHGTSVLGGADDLRVGDEVQFELGTSTRGPAAASVQVVGAEIAPTPA